MCLGKLELTYAHTHTNKNKNDVCVPYGVFKGFGKVDLYLIVIQMSGKSERFTFGCAFKGVSREG